MLAMVLKGLKQPLEAEQREIPKPKEHQALVRLKTAAFNRRDYWITQGMYPGIVFPLVLGSDGCGIVEEVGSEQDKHWIGQEVVLNPSLNWGSNPKVQAKDYKILGLPDDGTFAEYVLISTELLHPKPSFLTDEQAAAIPLAGLTAWRSLMVRAGLQKNEKVLITGIGGGVALFAALFAMNAGADVYVTSGDDAKLEKASQLGIKKGYNYKTENWHKQLIKEVGEMDVIIDSACGPGFLQLLDIAAPGGRIVFPGGTNGKIPEIIPAKIFWKQLSILGSTMGNNQEFADMLTFIKGKKMNIPVETVLQLSEAQKGLDLMENSNQFGKIVMKIN